MSPHPLQSALVGQMFTMWINTNTWVWCWTLNQSGLQTQRQSTRRACLQLDTPDVLSVFCGEHHLLCCGVLGWGHQGPKGQQQLLWQRQSAFEKTSRTSGGGNGEPSKLSNYQLRKQHSVWSRRNCRSVTHVLTNQMHIHL